MLPLMAAKAFAAGSAVVLIDDGTDPEPARLVISAATIDAEQMAFMVRYTSGFVTVAMPARRCDELQIPALTYDMFSQVRPVPAVAVDAAADLGTGISAIDRSHTARLLADPRSGPKDFTRPGHLVPLRVNHGAAGQRSTAASALLLCELAGLVPAAVMCELVGEDGELLTSQEAAAFSAAHGLNTVLLADLDCVRPEAKIPGLSPTLAAVGR